MTSSRIFEHGQQHKGKTNQSPLNSDLSELVISISSVPLVNNVESSANRNGLEFSKFNGTSLIKTKNSSGPSVEPCGTLVLIGRELERKPLSLYLL